MAFSDLCKISNAYKAVENESDQSERIMEENSMVRDLITKILDETGPTEGHNSILPPERSVGIGSPPNITNQYSKNVAGNTSFVPPTSYHGFQDNIPYNYPGQTQENGFNFPNVPNGFANANSFVNYTDSDISSLFGGDSIGDTGHDNVTPEQLNLLRLAAQEIGGAQFVNPNTKFDEKYFPFFENNHRSSTDPNLYPAGGNFSRPTSLSLHLDTLGFNSNPMGESNPYPVNPNNLPRYPNKFPESYLKDSQNTQNSHDSPNDILAYISQLSLSGEPHPSIRDEIMMPNNMPDYSKLQMELNGHSLNYQNGSDDLGHFKMGENKMYPNFGRNNFHQTPGNSMKPFNGVDNNYFLNEMIKQMGNEKSNFPLGNQNFDAFNMSPNVPVSGSMNYKPNGFQHQADSFMPRRDMTMLPPRDGYQNNNQLNEQRTNFDNPLPRGNIQQANVMRQNQELAWKMSQVLMRRPPPNQLNVDVNFLHENAQFNIGLGAFLGPSTSVPPPVLPSPMLDIPAPFYAIRNMRRTAQTSSAILHARLDACYEQWRQLERERKRTEARLALAYPGRAVSSSNSIPVPRLPSCPSRVDRLTVDMLREHTKVLTLMGKMETLRASVCVAHNKKNNKPNEDGKITLLKRGQENSVANSVANEGQPANAGVDPSTFDPASWKDDVKNLAEIAPHKEVEHAMLSWRNAVTGVQAARRRELAHHADPFLRGDPILHLADAVKQLCVSARRARCAMWCDLTLTVALAPPPGPTAPVAASNATNDKSQSTPTRDVQISKQDNPTKITSASKPPTEKKEEPSVEAVTETESNASENQTSVRDKPQPDGQKPAENQNQRSNQQRRTTNYRHKPNQQGRSTDIYHRNQRYDNRFTHRHIYPYLATGPIN